MPELRVLALGEHRDESDWRYCRIRNEYNAKIESAINQIRATL